MYITVHVETSAAGIPAPPQSPFFNKMLWSSKREQDLGMMPPPESSMVPMAPRRSSISLPSASDNISPPLHPLKQEYIDENSQSSLIDDHSERYRHISESSLDVHHGDSNMSMINDNSIDMMNQNTMINENSNLSTENSVEMMVRRGSVGSRVCESSMDVNLSNSQMSTINEDTSCSNVMQHCSSSVVTDRMVLSQPVLMHQNLLASAAQNEMTSATAEELKVMDLRMKMPMATAADLLNSTAPSMATLQSFGMTEAINVPLPAQSAQSVENFLTNIESKVKLQSEPVYLTSQRSFLQSDITHIVAKSEAAAIAEQTVSDSTVSTAPITTTAINNIPPLVRNNIAVPINTQKLDQFVNSTVESHIGSPTQIQTKDASSNVICDVMLTSRSNLMVAPIINTTLPPVTIIPELTQHSSPTLSPAVILNSQISPSLMCRNTHQDALICSSNPSVEPTVVPTLLTTSPPHPLVTSTESEKAVILKAAVDLFETQKKISELEHRSGSNKIMEDLMMTTSQMPVIPVPVKEMTGVDKKNEDRMIPQSFTALTENELINLINPSCFDQGNNSTFH